MAVVMYLFLMIAFCMIAAYDPITDEDGNVIKGRVICPTPPESRWSTMLCAILGLAVLLVVGGGPIYAIMAYEYSPLPPANIENDRWRLEYAALHGGEDPFSGKDASVEKHAPEKNNWWATTACAGAMCLLIGVGLAMNDDGEYG